MTAVWTRVRTELRARARTIAVLALVIGIAGGAALTAFAGARRTQTAVTRFLAYARVGDADLGSEQGIPDDVQETIVHLPQVAGAEAGVYLLMKPEGEAGDDLGTFGVARSYGGQTRPILLAGRTPNPDRADEVFLNAGAGADFKVGDRIRLQAWSPSQTEEVLRGTELPPEGPHVEVRVVGIGRVPSELSTAPSQPGVIYQGTKFALFTPAFVRQYRDQIGVPGGGGLSVRFKHGVADAPAFERAVKDISPDVFVDTHTDDRNSAVKARHATSIEALALLLFGVLAALVGIALVAQALARQSFLDASEYPPLAAMGMTRGQLISVATLRAAVLAVIGAALAVALAYAGSPFMPIGLARQAEVHRGFAFDASVLLLGAAAIVTLVCGAAAFSAWRTARTFTGAAAAGAAPAGEGRRPSWLAGRLTGAGARPSTVVGVRMALEPGRGATAVPVRTTLISAAVAVAVLIGTLTFGASLNRLANEPKLQGWDWDAVVGNPHSEDISQTAVPALDKNPDIAAFSGIAGPAGISVDGHQVGVMGVDPVKGDVMPPVIEGRVPNAPDEVMLGAKELRRLHTAVGKTIRVGEGEGTRTMKIVGRSVLTPVIANDQVRLGEGAVVTMKAFREVNPAGGDSENGNENVFIMRFKPGVNRAAALKRLSAGFPGTVLTAIRPADVENLRRVNGLPGLLAALFAAVALLTVGHMLVSSIRRRRHDVAILRTMGFVRRQVSATVAWQATTVILIALVVGVPAGLILGRWAWAIVANQLGVLEVTVVPAVAVLLIAAGSILAANALASVPALVAARTRPAEILRTE